MDSELGEWDYGLCTALNTQRLCSQESSFCLISEEENVFIHPTFYGVSSFITPPVNKDGAGADLQPDCSEQVPLEEINKKEADSPSDRSSVRISAYLTVPDVSPTSLCLRNRELLLSCGHTDGWNITSV